MILVKVQKTLPSFIIGQVCKESMVQDSWREEMGYRSAAQVQCAIMTEQYSAGVVSKGHQTLLH